MAAKKCEAKDGGHYRHDSRADQPLRQTFQACRSKDIAWRRIASPLPDGLASIWDPAGLNRVLLTGVLATDPQKDKGRDGAPITLLEIAFPAPDPTETEERPAVALQEIEVPEEVADKSAGKLQAGAFVFVFGQLNGGGGVIASLVKVGPPPDGSLP